MLDENGMKKCKECGKLFKPNKPQQKYCDAIHYRPCPVCGKPVVAKYLSDPARCCSGKCKSIAGKQHVKGEKLSTPVVDETPVVNNEVEEPVIDITKVRKYIGEPSEGYETDKLYLIEDMKDATGSYPVTSYYNVTDHCKCDATITFTNKKKISTVFRKVKSL